MKIIVKLRTTKNLFFSILKYYMNGSFETFNFYSYFGFLIIERSLLAIGSYYLTIANYV
jgi:hypothetical protein